MRKKREIARFARWCFAKCGVPPCKITYAPGECLIRKGQYVFGCYLWDEGTTEPGEIFVAYRIPTFGVMGVIAHEIWHHRQQMTVGIESMDNETCEADAEKGGEALLAQWLIRGGKVKINLTGGDNNVGTQEANTETTGA